MKPTEVRQESRRVESRAGNRRSGTCALTQPKLPANFSDVSTEKAQSAGKPETKQRPTLAHATTGEMEAKDSVFHFEKEQKVLCYHDNLLYEAVILDRKDQDGSPLYYVHYCGWADKWNAWVPETKVLAINEQNEALRMKLRRENALTSSRGAKEKTTMPEVLDNILYLEEEASEEMSQNWGDESRCTYSDGYIDQPVYACRECSEKAGRQFGFCYGCSMKCHVDHTVYELFEKRHFRCDCGVPRSACSCILDPCAPMTGTKLLDNDENKYNHNFDGLYCWCNKPYDHSSDVIMYMCVICQDWYHELCIKSMEGDIPAEQDFDDFFCKDCMAKHAFLLRYNSRFAASPASAVTTTSTSAETAETATSQECAQQPDISTPVGAKRKRDEKDDHGRETAEEKPDAQCKLAAAPQLSENQTARNAFWHDGWQQGLCRCADCLAMYEGQGLTFLLDYGSKKTEESTEVDVEGNEEEAPTSSQNVSLLSTSQEAFAAAVPPLQQLELLQGYQAMLEGLREHLRPFAERGQEVSKEDIESFFEQLNQKRRRTGGGK